MERAWSPVGQGRKESRLVSDVQRTRAGLFYGFAAYGAWGLVPLYFNSFECNPKEIVAHRVLWSALLLGFILTVFRRWPEVRTVFRQRRILLLLATSAYLVAANWYVYIFAVTSQQITQASLGYFILPLVNALIGMVFFGERPRVAQALALCLAAAGVVYLAVSFGQLPWIGITLAISFALYGVVRKVVPVDGILGLSIETFLLAPTAAVLLVVWEQAGGMAFGHRTWTNDVLIACSGFVTTFPLVCFAQAVRRVSLLTIGVLQYLSPSIQLIIGVFVFGEAFTENHQISFGLIWSGLLLFAIDSLLAVRRQRRQPWVRPTKEPYSDRSPTPFPE